MNKNFEAFLNNMEDTLNIFSVICITETWCNSNEANSNSNFFLPGFTIISLERKTKKRGGGIFIYIKENVQFIKRLDLTVSDDDKEVLTIEILTQKNKNILLSCCYRPPSGVIKHFNTFLNDVIFKKSNREKKLNYLIGDFNLDCLQYHVKHKIKEFYNDLFKNGAFPLITKPTRITESTTSIIDNIITNDIFNQSLKKGIIKSDITDHFPIFFSINTDIKVIINKNNSFSKRIYSKTNLATFNDQLSMLHWQHINHSQGANVAYSNFYKTFYDIYDANFPKIEINQKIKKITSPLDNQWIEKIFQN